MRSCAIIGGGLLGMTLALRLARSGQAVTIFEGAPALGGLASPWQMDDIVWDRHYHVILASDQHLRGLLRELSLDDEINWVQTRTGFYIDGKCHSLSNVLEFLRFPALGLIDKLRLGLTILHAARVRDWRPLERQLVADWLQRWSGVNTFRRIWLPLLRAKLGENYRKASAAFIWAIIARMYAARRSGRKQEQFGYVPGGYARIIAAFKRELEEHGVVIRTSAVIARVEAEEEGVRVMRAGGIPEHFGRCVITLAAPLCPMLCPSLQPEERQRLSNVTYQGIICASLLLAQPLSPYYITNVADYAPFTAIIEMSALVDRAQFRGKTLVYLPKYVDTRDPAFDLSDAQIQETFVSALERMCPSWNRGSLLAFKISRVRYVLPIPTLDYSANVPAMETSLPGLFIVNSAQIVNGTLNVNETVALANGAAQRIALQMPAAA